MDTTEVLLNQISQLREEVNNLALYSKHILDIDEAAKFLGLSKAYLYKLCQANQLPHFRSKGGKKIYFERKDLEEWMLFQRVGSSDEIKAEAIRRTA